MLPGKSVLQSSRGEDWNFCDIGATNVKETRLGEPVLIGRAIKRGWGEPSNEVGASHQTRLGRAIKRGWGEPSSEVGASPYSFSTKRSLGEPVGRASTKRPLGEPVLRGRWASHQTRLGRAIKRGWGEPSNEVGASHQTRLGEPVLIGRASWASQSQLLQWPPQWPTPAPAWRSYGARSAPGARSALCLLGTCPLGTFS